ncbi:MAG TPA: SgcJ/EcaC family oxidoreductase [Opitutaceae bacterium]
MISFLIFFAAAHAKAYDLGAAAKFIDGVNADWIPALQAHDADRAVRAMADDVVFVTAKGRVMSGRATVADALRKRFGMGSEITGGFIHRRSLAEANGVLIEWGDAEMASRTVAGKMTTTNQTYLTIWRLSQTGEWQIVRNLNF